MCVCVCVRVCVRVCVCALVVTCRKGEFTAGSVLSLPLPFSSHAHCSPKEKIDPEFVRLEDLCHIRTTLARAELENLQFDDAASVCVCVCVYVCMYVCVYVYV